jgi:hypothetical protein
MHKIGDFHSNEFYDYGILRCDTTLFDTYLLGYMEP